MACHSSNLRGKDSAFDAIHTQAVFCNECRQLPPLVLDLPEHPIPLLFHLFLEALECKSEHSNEVLARDRLGTFLRALFAADVANEVGEDGLELLGNEAKLQVLR